MVTRSADPAGGAGASRSAALGLASPPSGSSRFFARRSRFFSGKSSGVGILLKKVKNFKPFITQKLFTV